jgi:hypothetical protein
LERTIFYISDSHSPNDTVHLRRAQSQILHSLLPQKFVSIVTIHLHTVTAQTMILRKVNLKELTMYERGDGLMRGSREEIGSKTRNQL